MNRRQFIRGGLAAVAYVTTPLRALTARSSSALFSDPFRRAATAKGWGKPWFNQRRGLRWGIAKKKGFYDLPSPQPGAGRHTPNPVVVLDHDVLDIDLKAKLSSTNAGARFGVVARVVGYSDFYAAYFDKDRLVVSNFGVPREDELRARAFAVKAGAAYWLRLKISGTAPVVVHAKAWRAGTREPSTWMISVQDPTQRPIRKPGSFGFVFLHDDVTHRKARVRVSQFKALSTDAPRKTEPELTFAFAGRTERSDGGFRTRVVAKTDIPADVVFHVGSDPRLRTFTEVRPTDKFPKALVSKGWLTGLAPGTTIYWRAVATSRSGRKNKGRIRRFKTPPSLGDGFSLAFGSCSYPFPDGRSFSRAADVDPFLFAHLGDFGYAANDLEGAAAMTATTGSYQDRWTRMLARPAMTKLHRRAAWIMLQDDHDYGRNNCWSQTVRPFTIGAFDELSGNSGRRFFDIPYGDAHCFFVDTHVYADNPEVVDGPEHSLLGSNQKSWLKSAMRSSTADLLIVLSPMPLWGAGSGRFGWKSAFAYERRELLEFFFSLQGPNRRVIVCSGNSHAHLINHHRNPGGGKDVIEFVSSGTDRFKPGLQKPLPDDGVIDPVRALKDIDGFGYVRLKPAGQNPRVELRAINPDTGRDLWPMLSLDL